MADGKQIAELRAALKAHKTEIENAHGESLAAQVLVVGLMNAMIKRGFDRTAIDDAFEYGAMALMAASEKTKAPQTTRALKVIEDLREAIL